MRAFARRVFAVAAFAAAVLLVVTLSSAAAPQAETCQDFSDPTGDAVAGSPDISSVQICLGDDDFITARVSIPNRPSGLLNGPDYREFVDWLPTGSISAWIVYDPGHFYSDDPCVWKAWPSEWGSKPSLSCSYASGVLTMRINRSEIGNPSSLRFSLQVQRSGTGVADSVLGAIDWGPDISLIKSQSDDQVVLGQDITYTLAVFNAGPAVAQNVQVTDTLPAGVTLRSVAASQGTCGGLTCALGKIDASENATMTVVARPTATGTVVNSATATATNDTTPANNTSSVTASVVGSQPPPPPPPPSPPPPPPPPGDNHPPLARPDSTQVFVGAVRDLDVVRNDSDSDGDPLAVESFRQGRFGQVKCSGHTCSYLSHKTGKDSFAYTVGDGRGGTATATVAVAVGRERAIEKRFKAKGCKPAKKKNKKKKKRCKVPSLPRTVQGAALGGASSGLSPAGDQTIPFASSRGRRCFFTKSGYGLGHIAIAGWQKEFGKTGTNIMMERFRLQVLSARLLGAGHEEWVTRDHVDWWWTYPNDVNSYYTPYDNQYRPPHLPVWTFWFNGLYENTPVRLQSNFQWRRSYLGSHNINWRASRVIYETGWFTACAGEPHRDEGF
jgi:uncharacterized repeat protein (TIGR01451 family)